jgi:ABC-type antimicrobial peptide transport system permease subunit
MALLKLVGFDSDGLVRMILAESALSGMLASTIAVLIAAVLTATLRLGISVEGYTMRPEMSTEVVITSLLAGLLLSLLGAWLPSAGVARRPIVTALKGVD